MLKYYDMAYATCPRKGRFALEEKGVDYERHPIEMTDPLRADEDSWFRTVNPRGELPIMDHDGRWLRESTVICEYAEEAFEGPALLPAEPYWRAVARLWMKRLEVEIHYPHHVAINCAIAFVPDLANRGISRATYLAAITPSRQPVIADIFDHGIDSQHVREGFAAYDRLFADMEVALTQTPWLAGETFSLAEVGVAPWALRMGEEFALADILWEGRPRIREWFARIRERPGFRRAIDTPGAAEWIVKFQDLALQSKPEVERMMADVRAAR